MKIEAFLLAWNEIAIMDFVIKHYQEFCDHIVIMDNFSTDGSPELALKMGCEVRQFGTSFFDDEENRKCKNTCWLNSKADWCFVADFDELPIFKEDELTVGTPGNIPSYLDFYEERGATIFKTRGWQIMSDEVPKESFIEVTNGFEFSNYAKSICFSPKHITAINYNPGAHLCNPEGNIHFYKHDYWEPELYVLHYKHIGGVQRTIDRYKILNKRMSKENNRKGYGIHYKRSPGSIREEWNERMAKSKPLI
jgi:glycosyltransferase involved in cell wall biosynthesis